MGPPKGVEPSPSDYKTDVLPLNYGGIEPQSQTLWGLNFIVFSALHLLFRPSYTRWSALVQQQKRRFVKHI